MTIIERNFSGETHFLIRLTFALTALVAVAMLWIINVPGLSRHQVTATLDDPNCEECVQLWIEQNISNIELTVGAWTPEATGAVEAVQ